MLVETFVVSYWPLIAYGLAAFVSWLWLVAMLDELF